MSLPELLARAAAQPSHALDVDGVWRRGRRRRLRVRAAASTGVAGLAIVAALVLPGILAPEPGGVALLPGPAETATAMPPPPPSPSAAPTSTPPADWPDFTLAEALDRLMAVNETAPAGPADGVRVTRTLTASSSTPWDTGVTTVDISVRELRLGPDWESGSIWGAPIADGLDPATSPDDFREIVAATDLAGLVLDFEFDLSEGVIPSEVGPTMTLDDMLAHAEMLAATVLPSPLPQEYETERPPHASAANTVADALQESVPSPQQRIRALRVLAGLDTSIVQYGGVVRDLLGREGIAIVLLDPPADVWKKTLVFSPDTGEQLGSLDELAPGAPGQQASYWMHAVLAAEIRPQ